MNRDTAKEILLIHRPGVDDPFEPDTAAALAMAKTDPELQLWLDSHQANQNAISDAFAHVKVPEGLKEQIVSETRARMRETARRKLLLQSVGVAFALLLAFVMLWPDSGVNDYNKFRNRMVGDVQRAYPQMDLETSNPAEIRNYLASKGYGNYQLPGNLDKTVPTGCKLLRWHNEPVTMICYTSGTTSNSKAPDLFLFVLDRKAVKLPRSAASIETVGNLATATWITEKKVYLLAGQGDSAFLKKFL